MNLLRLKNVSLILLSLFFLGACGAVPRGSVSSGSVSSSPVAASVSDMNHVMQQLHGAHSEWEGTPYLLGGSGINGVDCSSFIQIVFKEFFSRDLPRHTRAQLQEGSGVRRGSILPGDLVFFRTNRGVLHVGIAMEQGDFLHASVSNGVMISNLSQNYWAGRYLGARRVL
jgi:cell wall-associated NlpC family hydrolase